MFMQNSLSEVNQTIDTRIKKGFLAKLFSFIGPAYLISIGYMDPGNWATDIAAGSSFGYKLLWVLLLANLIALLMQTLSARLGIVRGLDLAQATRETYPRIVNFILYIFAEIAVASCDLAEVLGMAIGLNLLFGIPLVFGVLITLFDTFILLFLINKGIRKTEAFIVGLICIIGLAFLVQIIMVQPSFVDIFGGFVPKISSADALYIAIGIIGATVMPHNLYLHSSLVQTRKFERDEKGISEAIKYNLIDTFIALNVAFLINAAILILSATSFYKNGFTEVSGIADAYKLLGPLLGSKLAPVLFALSLILAGQSSTISGTLAGQVIMEGHIQLRIQPWVRRMLTRLLAIIPAIITILFFGEENTGNLLILSQVILSLQLGFAVIPMIHLVSDKDKMQGFELKFHLKFLSWLSAIIIVVLNVWMAFSEIKKWFVNPDISIFISFFVTVIALFALSLLFYITFMPMFRKLLRKVIHVPHYKYEKIEISPISSFKKIAVAIDFSIVDKDILNAAVSIGDNDSEFVLIHIIESASAIAYGAESNDLETSDDKQTLINYSAMLTNAGYKTSYIVGYGNPKKQIPKIVKDFNADILIMGSHGHKFFKDIIYGTTISAVRHDVKIPVLIVNKGRQE